MTFTTMRNFNIYTSKFLFSNVYKAQLNQELFNIDCRSFSSKAVFKNIHSLFTNFRTLFISPLFKEEIKMVSLTFVTHDGKEFKKKIPVGKELHSAFEHGGDEIPIFGACGGNRACATCHIKIPEHLVNKVRKLTDEEEDTLICANEFDPHFSRLSCCIKATEDMEGAILLVPEIVGDKRNRD